MNSPFLLSLLSFLYADDALANLNSCCNMQTVEILRTVSTPSFHNLLSVACVSHLLDRYKVFEHFGCDLGTWTA